LLSQAFAPISGQVKVNFNAGSGNGVLNRPNRARVLAISSLCIADFARYSRKSLDKMAQRSFPPETGLSGIVASFNEQLLEDVRTQVHSAEHRGVVDCIASARASSVEPDTGCHSELRVITGIARILFITRGREEQLDELRPLARSQMVGPGIGKMPPKLVYNKENVLIRPRS